MAFAQRVEGDCGLGPDACDFLFGNPQETPLRGLVEALIRHAEPRDVRRFGYKKYDSAAREAVTRSLRQSRGRPYEPADVAITAGGFGAIAAALLRCSRSATRCFTRVRAGSTTTRLSAARRARPSR
jgi:aspartate aminotransferase